MKKIIFTLVALTITTSVYAHDESKLKTMPPDAPYVQVSEVLPLPEFLPGLGTLFVKPKTLPAGPFLSYDHDGKLSATVYMTPIAELKNGISYDGLGVGSHTIDGVDIYYNAGHPGVDSPHVHVVLYHDKAAKKRLEK